MVAGSPHGRGLFEYVLVEVNRSEWVFDRRVIDDSLTQVHAVRSFQHPRLGWIVLYGKRVGAHGPDGDLDPRGTPVLMLASRAGGSWRRVRISHLCGVGLQIAAAMIANVFTVAVSTRLGIHLFREIGEPFQECVTC